ncbi:site-specific DNA-methyltransferase [Staphylococcus pseudintermedius]|nr:site-specific DNA-methyltransferase [Staphylococcus pseudintermedius]
MIELNKIYNEDCLEGMKRIPDKSVDMILCDLPYGTTRNKWDTVIDLEKLWEQYKRVIKDNGAIVLTAQTPFDKVLGASNLEMLKYEWIWEKTTATGWFNAKKMPMKAHENILVFYRKPPIYNYEKTKGHKPMNNYTKKADVANKSTTYGKVKKDVSGGGTTERYPRSVIKFSTDKQKSAIHPTQKPVALFEYLIKTYSNEGETVLDNFIGSGTTAVACLNTKRNYIGFELDEEYYEVALKRIELARELKQNEQK